MMTWGTEIRSCRENGVVIGSRFLKVFSTHTEAVLTSREIASVL